MTIFLFSLAGIPPLAGWFAKFVMFRSVLDAGTPGATVLGVIAAVNSVIAFFYYVGVVAARCGSTRCPTTIDATPIADPARARRRDRASARSSCSWSACTRRCSPGSASSRQRLSRRRVPAAASHRRAHPPRGPIPFDAFVEARALRTRAGSSRAGSGAGRAGRRLRHQPRGRLAVRRVRRARARPLVGRARASPTRSSSSRPARATAASRATCCAPSPTCARRAALRARRALRRAARRAARAPARSSRPTRRSARRAARPPTTRRCRSPALGPVVAALDELPALAVDGVVLANELLDNLPFGIAECDRAGWDEVRVAVDDDGAFVEVLVPADRPTLARWVDDVDAPVAARRLPGCRSARSTRGSTAAAACCAAASCCSIDYVDDARRAASRAAASWLRTYRGHERGGDPLDAPGDAGHHRRRRASSSCAAPRRAPGFTLAADRPQAEWLARPRHRRARRRGPAHVGGAARHVGDLDALAGRSRVTEAAALTDPAGLGAHRVAASGRSADDRARQGDRRRRRMGSLRIRPREGSAMADGRSRRCCRKAARSRRPTAFVARRARHRRVASTTTPSATGRASGPTQALALDWTQRVAHDPRVGPAVREVVRRRQAQRRVQLPRPPRRGRPRRPGRVPLGGRARRHARRSPTRELLDETCRVANALQVARRRRRATASRSTWAWCPSCRSRCSRARGSAPPHSVVFGGFTARVAARPHQRRRGQGARHRRRRVAARRGRRAQGHRRRSGRRDAVDRARARAAPHRERRRDAGRPRRLVARRRRRGSRPSARPSRWTAEDLLFILYTSRHHREAQGHHAHDRRLPHAGRVHAQVRVRPPPRHRRVLVHRRRRLGHRPLVHRLRPAREPRDERASTRARPTTPTRTGSGRSSRSTRSRSSTPRRPRSGRS